MSDKTISIIIFSGFVVMFILFCILVRTKEYEIASLRSNINGLEAEINLSENKTSYLFGKIETLEMMVEKIFQTAYHAEKPIYSKIVTATAYSARVEECDDQPWFTASMTLSRVGVLAVSKDLEAMGLTLGRYVIIEGMGLFRIEDRMNSRWKNRIDILHANYEAAIRFKPREVTILWVGM